MVDIPFQFSGAGFSFVGLDIMGGVLVTVLAQLDEKYLKKDKRMDSVIQALLTLATGLFLSIVTAILTVKLSLRQFYSQRWWEKKQDQYEKILTALYHIRHTDEKLLASVEVGKDLDPERKQSLLAKSREGSEELEKVASIGAFAISKEALASLKRLRTNFDTLKNNFNDMSYFEYLEKHVSFTDDCISEIILIGRKELKIG